MSTRFPLQPPGTKIHQLTIVKFIRNDKRSRRVYLWRCDCGNYKEIYYSAVKCNNTHSCGCYSQRVKKEKNLLPGFLGAKRQLILQYKRHARNRKIEYFLSEKEFLSLIDQNCHYCNTPPSNLKKTKNLKEGILYSGIDRVNSGLGYFLENCVPCCNICNKAKLALDKDVFLDWVTKVYNHSILNPPPKTTLF